MRSELSIGTAEEIITPPIGCQMAGFDARKGVAESIHDDLHARAMVLDDGVTRIALISVELLGVGKPFADKVRRAVENRTGIPVANVVIAATHTHCGPVTFNHFYNQGQPLDRQYLDFLASAILKSIERAASASRPRRIRAGLVRVDGIAVNRRSADGKPVDPFAGILLIEELDGTPAAVAISFACHTTVLGPNTLAITGDFPFFTIQRLRHLLVSSLEVLYFNGAEGDISIGHKSDLSAVGVIASFRTFEKAEQLGTQLAETVASSLSTLSAEEPILRIRRHELRLPLKSYQPLPVMVKRREDAADLVRSLETSGRDGEPLLHARQQSLFSRIEEYYALLYEQAIAADPKTLPVELIAVGIGSTALLTFPGEVFVSIGLDIRERSKFSRTMFLGLANDYIGYIPTADANAEAGYEVVASRVSPKASAVLVKGAVKLLDSISGHLAAQ